MFIVLYLLVCFEKFGLVGGGQLLVRLDPVVQAVDRFQARLRALPRVVATLSGQ